MNENRPAGAGTSLQSMSGPAHSTLKRLTADPGSPGYALDDTGRRYFLTHAADGSTVPIPVELTDEQRAELDAARDRANAYADQVRFDDAIADVVPLRPHEPDAGDL